MGYAFQWIRSLIFNIQMYIALAVIAIGGMPLVLIHRPWAFRVIHAFCGYVRWSASWIINLKSEIRGTPPQGAVLVAAKHQSFFDVILIVSAVERPRFVMKASLAYTPFVAFYARSVGCIAVNRSKRSQAIKKMVEDLKNKVDFGGQLIIYPQGTRVAPDVKAPYKVGAAVLYAQTGFDCVPAATNVGYFWPRSSVYRRPGTAVVEFLDPMPAGMDKNNFLNTLETRVEAASNALLAEAKAKA